MLLVRAIAGDAELGTYSAAFKVFEAATILPTIVMAAGLPPLARAPGIRCAGVTGSGCSPASFGDGRAGRLPSAYGARRPIVALLFGADFVAAVPSLGIIAAAIPLSFLNAGCCSSCVARGLERRNVMVSGVVLMINVGVNLVAIPRLGGPGAAWATVVTEAAVDAGVPAGVAAALHAGCLRNAAAPYSGPVLAFGGAVGRTTCARTCSSSSAS